MLASHNSEPFISIFIPTYNRVHYLRECLDSCLEQNYDDYEIVVGDDGSSDDTPVMMADYMRKHPRIRYFRFEENTQAAHIWSLARNACGRYLFRMGDDDRVFPDVLASYSKAALNYGADIVYGDLSFIDSSGVQTLSKIQYRDYFDQRPLLLKTLLRGCALPLPGSMIRTDLYWKRLVEDGYLGFPVYSYDERGLIPSLAGRATDYLEWVMLVRGTVMKHMGGFSVRYRIHGDQDSSMLYKNGSEESFVQRMLLCFYGLREIFPEFDWEGKPEAAECQALSHIGRNFLAIFDVMNASYFFNRAFEKSMEGAKSCLGEVLRWHLACYFRTHSRVRPEIARMIERLNDPVVLQMLEEYSRASDMLGSYLDNARKLMASGNLKEAEDLLKRIIDEDLFRTAAIYDLLSRLYKQVEDYDLAYQCAIYSMAMSGYSGPSCNSALDVAARIGREDECLMTARRTFIQPWYIKGLLYTEEMLHDWDMISILEVNRRNEGTGLYSIEPEGVETSSIALA